MLKIQHYIKIKDTYVINGFSNIVIEDDVDTLTNTCKITLPIQKDKVIFNKNSITYLVEKKEVIISRGDKVEVELYYKGKRNHKKQFIGYISRFDNKDGKEIILNCDDEMFTYKQDKLKFSYAADTDLRTYCKFLLGVQYNSDSVPTLTKSDDTYDNSIDKNTILDSNIGKIRADSYITRAEAFAYLKDKFKFSVFFRNEYELNTTGGYDTTPTFYAGFRYATGVQNYSKTIKVSKEGILYKGNPSLQSKFEPQTFNKETDLIVIITSLKNDTRLPEVFATVNGVNVITVKSQLDEAIATHNYKLEFKLPNLDSNSAREYVLDKWNTFSKGVTGQITILGLPLMRQGDIVEVYDENETPQAFYIDKVITECNAQKGFVQNLFLGGNI